MSATRPARRRKPRTKSRGRNKIKAPPASRGLRALWTPRQGMIPWTPVGGFGDTGYVTSHFFSDTGSSRASLSIHFYNILFSQVHCLGKRGGLILFQSGYRKGEGPERETYRGLSPVGFPLPARTAAQLPIMLMAMGMSTKRMPCQMDRNLNSAKSGGMDRLSRRQ